MNGEWAPGRSCEGSYAQAIGPALVNHGDFAQTRSDMADLCLNTLAVKYDPLDLKLAGRLAAGAGESWMRSSLATLTRDQRAGDDKVNDPHLSTRFFLTIRWEGFVKGLRLSDTSSFPLLGPALFGTMFGI